MEEDLMTRVQTNLMQKKHPRLYLSKPRNNNAFFSDCLKIQFQALGKNRKMFRIRKQFLTASIEASRS